MFPEPLVFAPFAKGLDGGDYDAVPTFDELRRILEEGLRSYNETNAQMNLVLFEDAMKHVCRIGRIIQNSHCLLVGVGGMGKQSLSRLGAFICGFVTTQIQLSGSYGITELKEDLKIMYNKAGVKGEKILFLFTDSQIAKEQFLVYMNDLLSSGDIADLFPPDEKDNCINAVRNEVKGEGISDTKENCWDFFIGKVKANLHVSLCFSPVGENFRRRALRFPALVNCTVIDWFQPWPEEALLSVSMRFLAEVDLGTDEIRTIVQEFMPYSFLGVNKASEDYLRTDRRYNYTTPKSFLELIKLYSNMLNSKPDS